MPQMLLPIFPDDIKLINSLLGFVKKDSYVYYFNGQMPIFHHPEDDLQSFKMFVSQLYICGNASQSEIVRAFGISQSSIKRWVKKYKEGGVASFFNKTRRGSATILTSDKIAEIQLLLDSGEEIADISDLSGVKKSTILKGIYKKKLHKLKKKQ